MPFMDKLARCILWRYGHLNGLFHHLGYKQGLDIKYGKIKPMPCMQDVSITRMVINLTSDSDVSSETEDQLTVIPEDVFEDSEAIM